MQEKRILIFWKSARGGGIFAILCVENLPVKNYVIIDLPEMLEVAKNNILKHAPHVMNRIAFLTSEQKPEIQFNAFFNFMSFCEMEEREIREYFNLIYSTAKSSAIFFNENSHKKIKNKDGGVSDNNPLLFPYRGRPILWGVDEMRKVNKPFNPAYIRIEIIEQENTMNLHAR